MFNCMRAAVLFPICAHLWRWFMLRSVGHTAEMSHWRGLHYRCVRFIHLFDEVSHLFTLLYSCSLCVLVGSNPVCHHFCPNAVTFKTVGEVFGYFVSPSQHCPVLVEKSPYLLPPHRFWPSPAKSRCAPSQLCRDGPPME